MEKSLFRKNIKAIGRALIVSPNSTPPILTISLLITLIVFIFFFRLFIPQAKLFYTPDFGRSDLWHFNYPLKEFLGQSLKKGQLPFWSKKVATGFPFFSEGQIGSLNLFNLLLFSTLPTWLAWNLSYLLIFFFAFLGSYLFFAQPSIKNRPNFKKEAKIQFDASNFLAAFFSAFIFSFSGFFICHIPHFNLIQSSAFLPWVFLAGDLLWKKAGINRTKGNKININKTTKISFVFFAFILSQQFFSGHPQISFITLLGFGLFLAFKFFQERNRGENKQKLVNNRIANYKLLLTISGLVFAFCLAAPQLLPTFELTQISARQAGLNEETIFRFPYLFKDLTTFLLPNIFGSSKDGSYPGLKSGQGIYWENTAYLGILPLIFLAINLLKRKKSALEKFFWFLLVFSLLLVLGKQSPLYFLASFPGFNYFRTPSRFLLLTIFSLSFLAGCGLKQTCLLLKNRLNKSFLNLIVVLLVLVSFFDLVWFGFNYHPLVTLNQALEPPATTNIIAEKERLYSLGNQMNSWNNVFINHGWQSIAPFIFFKNGLDADLSLLFNRENISAFYGLAPSRQRYYQEAAKRKLINAAGVKYLISSEQLIKEKNEAIKTRGFLNSADLELTGTVKPNNSNLNAYFIYQNQQKLNRFRFNSEYQVFKTVAEFLRTVEKEDFSFANTALLETELYEEFNQLKLAQLNLIKDEDQELILETKTDSQALLIMADSFYPGWMAEIDDQKTNILPANLNQRALVIPPGEHLIRVWYYPRTFYQGLLISLGGVIVFFFLSFYWPKFSKKISFFS